MRRAGKKKVKNNEIDCRAQLGKGSAGITGRCQKVCTLTIKLFCPVHHTVTCKVLKLRKRYLKFVNVYLQ